MVYDNICNIEQYKGDSKLYAALVAVRQFVNDIPYDKESVVSINQIECSTMPIIQAKAENHRIRTDIHYVVSGTERILVNDHMNLIRLTEYSQEKDFELFALSGEEKIVDLQAGEFLVLYPGEIHAPKVAVDDEVAPIKKVVVKL